MTDPAHRRMHGARHISSTSDPWARVLHLTAGMREFEVSSDEAVRAAIQDPPHASTHSAPSPAALEGEELARLDAWFRAANYLTVGQIYLMENPLLRAPLHRDHIKPRLLGHWGTSPGLNLLYAHLNRLIRREGMDALLLVGPGHGGPAILANVYLEGVYSSVYPEMSQDVAGMRRLFRQFSTPGGVPSHVGPTTPGSIHEGGELGYVLSHAFGAAFDNPELLVVAIVGDGEAETAPLEGSWKGISFLNPARDGAVLPILHLNGYKIAGPTVLGRKSDADLASLYRGHGYDLRFVEGDVVAEVHQKLARELDRAYADIRAIQRAARNDRSENLPRWPMIALRTPKGWTGPKVVDGVAVEGTFRAHQVPLTNVRDNPQHLAILEAWLRSYHPESLFDEAGTLLPSIAEHAPRGDKRMSASPHANGGSITTKLKIPDFRGYASPVTTPGTLVAESTRALGALLRDVFRANRTERNFRLFCPDETNSNRLGAVFEVENRCLVETIFATDDHVARDGRVLEVLSEHFAEGALEGYLLTGRHGMFATYEAFALVVASMVTQHAKWLETSAALAWREPVSSLNILLTSTCWRNDHNGFSHQGPGFMDTVLSKRGNVARIYLPPDANCLLAISDHCLRSHDYVNLIIIDKQPQLQWLDIESAELHCASGAGIFRWASHVGEPDIIMACAGDVATLETLAATSWLRTHAPELRLRVVNVVDLMSLPAPSAHPHGMSEERFDGLFGVATDVVFAFHGYAGAIHQLLHCRPSPQRFHVRGYIEEGTTTTPFDMVVLNRTSRFHLAIEAVRRSTLSSARKRDLISLCNEALDRHRAYVDAHFEDMPEISEWRWSDT